MPLRHGTARRSRTESRQWTSPSPGAGAHAGTRSSANDMPGGTVPWLDQRSHRPFGIDRDGSGTCPTLRISGARFLAVLEAG